MAYQPDYRFEHVHIYCSDLDASEQWFIEKVGAELIRRRDPRPTRATDLVLGGATLFLREEVPGENLGAAGPARFGTDHIGLLVHDLDATVAELKSRGVTFEMEPKQINAGLKIAYIQGPDQVRIELLQRS